LLERRIANTPRAYEHTGNVLLDRLFGTHIEFREPGLDMNAEAQARCTQLLQNGAKPYFIPGGGSNEIGALGYVACAQEIMHQSAAMAMDFDWIVLATGSTGTQAGLVAGLHQLGYSGSVMGISVRQPRDKQIKAVHGLCERTLEKLGVDDTIAINKIKVDDGFVGDGYGIPAESTLDAISIAARYEGLLLDPVYSGKGFAGLLSMARGDFFKPTDKVLFLHTGGSSALFAYEETLVDYVS
jgi:L-cysteate sulfo-lyase